MSPYEILTSRGVTRLCHFTKLQSFTHIITTQDGILASNSIRQDTKNVLDEGRYDGELDYICCSVQYPNSWFLRKAIDRNTDTIFRDFLVLYIDPSILQRASVKFCPCNSSLERGRYISDKMEDLESIYNRTVPGFDYLRSSKMLQSCPTNGQAEILIKGCIPNSFIKGIAVGNEEVGKQVYSILKMFGKLEIPIYLAPDVLTPNWSKMARNGTRPVETQFHWND